MHNEYMRLITEIILHHSVTNRDYSLHKSLKSFDSSHAQRLTQIYAQPLGRTSTPNIAYHYVIAGNGEYRNTRDLSVMGFHASNWQANKRSVGICLTGNFNIEKPSEAQMQSLKKIIAQLKKDYPTIGIVTGHRDYTNTKNCPGDNFPDKLIKEMDALLKPKVSWWNFLPPVATQLANATRALGWAKGLRKVMLKRKIARLSKKLIA